MSRTYVKWALVLAMIVILAFAVPALAKGPGGGGKPDNPGGDETAANNLSWPTVMIGGTMGLTSPTLALPSGSPLSGYEVAGFYYVQGVHKWQAEYDTAAFATGTAEWGDNLAGDAALKVGSPIRVELGLFDDTGLFQMQGFTVVKLEPSKLDRESAYGTLAVSEDAGATYHGTPEILTPARIYDAGVTFSVKNLATGLYAVDPGTSPTAEINATGKVVYGYNLRVSAAGQYDITFSIPSVDITYADSGSTWVTDRVGDVPGLLPDTVTLTITVAAGGGGGGGKRP